MQVNIWDQLDAIKELIVSGDPVDPEQRRRVDAALAGAMRPAVEAS